MVLCRDCHDAAHSVDTSHITGRRKEWHKVMAQIAAARLAAEERARKSERAAQVATRKQDWKEKARLRRLENPRLGLRAQGRKVLCAVAHERPPHCANLILKSLRLPWGVVFSSA